MSNLIFYNARVITLDASRPDGELVAIRENRIAAVAGNDALADLRTQDSKIIDCSGAALLPGFVDAHCHINAYAEALVSLDLSPRHGGLSISDIQRSVRDSVCTRVPGSWIRGKGYNEFYIAEKRHPNRWDLDAAAPLHPVKLTHRSGHAHVLNSLALERVGITDETGDPPGGMIDRNLDTGLPTGILYGMGEFLARKIPAMEDAEIERGMVMGDKRLLACGITSIQDASSVNSLHQWRRFVSWKTRGLLHPRLRMMMGFGGFGEWQKNRFTAGAETDPQLGGVKFIVSRTTGSVQPCREELNEMILEVHQHGLQVAVHAIEEPEIAAACDAIEFALVRHPRSDHRHRIEHCSVCPPYLRKRIAELGIMVVTQPSFIYFSGDRYLKTIPKDQMEHLYPIGSILRRGIATGFASDFPISDPNPLIGIHAAVTRTTETDVTVLPQQCIGLLDALRLYTLGAAASGFEEGIKGSITPGKLADLVILDEDPRDIDPTRIKDVRAMMTVLDGRIAWSDGRLSG